MKIAFIANSSWNLYNFRLGLMCALREENHQIIAIAPEDAYTPRLQRAGFPFFAIKLQNTGIHLFTELHVVVQLWRLYARLRPDILLNFTIKPNVYGAIVAALQGRVAINNVSGLGTAFMRGGIMRYGMWLLYGLVFPMAGHTFFQNAEDHALAQAKLSHRPFSSSCIPGSGVNVRRFSSTVRANPLAKKDGFTFLMMARLIIDKGVYEYVEAARRCHKRHSGLRYLLIGAHDQAHRHAVPAVVLQHWQREGYITYLGPHSDVMPLLQEADAVVLPSYREGLPRSLLEGAAMAKPLIATNVPGCRAVVRPGYNGLLCPSKDAKALADAMDKLLQMPVAMRCRWGRNSRTLVTRCFDERFVWDTYIKKINEIG